MARYGFDYFSGANVIVYLQEMPLLECAGFTYEISESKRPIYGYASRYFDAVARGQVLVQGELLVNYVHQDYLFTATNLALGNAGLTVPESPDDSPVNEADMEDMLSVLSEVGVEQGTGVIDAAIKEFWTDTTSNPSSDINNTYNLHDASGGFDIRVAFGFQDDFNARSGQTGLLLSGVHFLGRGQRIEIDENTIVERYTFFARNVYSKASGVVINQVSGVQADSSEIIISTP